MLFWRTLLWSHDAKIKFGKVYGISLKVKLQSTAAVCFQQLPPKYQPLFCKWDEVYPVEGKSHICEFSVTDSARDCGSSLQYFLFLGGINNRR